jgi:predicted CopG family antitoxin
MGSKNITVTDEAYDRLKSCKQPNESFTDTVLRLTRGDKDVFKGLGAWTGTENGKRVEATRRKLNSELDERHDELSRQ